MVAAMHHKIAIDIHIVQDRDDPNGSWDLKTDPPLEKCSPEVAAAMNAATLYDADMATGDVNVLRGDQMTKAFVTLNEGTLRRFAKRLAKTGKEEIKASKCYFVPLPDWSEACTGRYLQIIPAPLQAGVLAMFVPSERSLIPRNVRTSCSCMREPSESFRGMPSSLHG